MRHRSAADRHRTRTRRAGHIAALLTALTLTGQPAAADTSLWKIGKAGRTLYLGGTIHVLRPGDFPLPQAFDRAFDAADIVGLETDIGQLHSARFQQAMLQQLRYPTGDSLSHYLSEPARDALASYCGARGIALDPLLDFKPAFAMTTLLATELQRLGVTSGGVDLHFHRQAVAAGKPLAALETPEQQLAYVTTLGVGEESEFILQLIAEIDQLQSTLDDMIAAWRAGDTARLNALIVEPMASAYPGVYRQLLVERNRAWLPAIEAWLATDATELVLVGTAHLAGPDGLLASLRQRGYAIEQL